MMRSVSAAVVAWSGRGPVLRDMGLSFPGADVAPPPGRALPGGPDASDRTVVPAERAASPAAVLHRPRVRDPVGAGRRRPVAGRPAHGHRDVAGPGPGPEAALVARAPGLRPRGVGPRPAGARAR